VQSQTVGQPGEDIGGRELLEPLETEVLGGDVGDRAAPAARSPLAVREALSPLWLLQHGRAALTSTQHAAPLFGIYMVARATNNSVMADGALAGIRLRNGPMAVAPHTFGDSAMRRVHAAVRGRG
jgi:hypothetical protein